MMKDRKRGGWFDKLTRSAYRDFYESRGWPVERWLDLGLELDNTVFGKHPGVTFGFHTLSR